VVSKRVLKALDRWVGEQRDQEERKVADNGQENKAKWSNRGHMRSDNEWLSV
jgi:hypothetical protein